MTDQKWNPRLQVYLCVALGLITLALYLPTARHDFLTYDDQQYVTENIHVKNGLSVQNVIWAFGYHASNWHPLTWLSHMLDCQLYGLKPAGHYLTNVILHVCNTLILFLLLNRMTGAAWRSASVAALFAWHPLHVESVAWVAERKDVLSTFFWMLTLLAYAHYAGKPSASRYLMTLGSFALGLMAKPMVVTLPFVLLLLDFWPLKRFTGNRNPASDQSQRGTKSFPWRRLLAEKIPFLLLTGGACALTIAAQEQAIVSTAGLPISQRISHAALSYLHYFGAMFWPRSLAVYHPYEITVPAAEIVFAFLVLVVISLIVVRWAQSRPYLIVGWFWFLGTLVPVIGLVQVGDQAWADRYTYIPLVGLFAALVWALVDLTGNRLWFRVMMLPVGVALLIGTSVQLRHWKNTRTLFTHAAQVTRNNHMAITMLGSLLAKEGKLDEAMEHYRTALSLKPGYPEAHFFLGNALDQRGKLEEAVSHYSQVLWYSPTREAAHVLLGIALTKQKKYDDAAVHYRAALKLNPESAVAHNNFARLLHLQGQLDEAIEHYSAALKLDPLLAQGHNNLGILLLQKGRGGEGTARLREALRLNPDNLESQHNLALALNQQFQWREAAELFSKTVRSNSSDPKAHYEFAVALAHLKKTREAMSEYAAALLIQPDFPDALDGLAWILSTDTDPAFRNGAEAVKMAERANTLTDQKDPVKLKTLAAAYAETGRFEEAINTLRAAKALAGTANLQELVNECESLLERFQRAESWRGQ